MLPTLTKNPETLREACEFLAPEDRIDRAHPSDLAPNERNVLLGRKVGLVRSSLALVANLAGALDGDDAERPNRAEAEQLLAEVAAWAAEPTAEGEARVAEAWARGPLATKVRTKRGEVLQGQYGGPLQKACYHAIMATKATKPSDAASHLVPIAFTTARIMAELAGKPSDYAHGRLIGLITGAADAA